MTRKLTTGYAGNKREKEVIMSNKKNLHKTESAKWRQQMKTKEKESLHEYKAGKSEMWKEVLYDNSRSSTLLFEVR